ncbi:hypothetical protein BC833DRAFT_571630 [Globomyces pollinis-pini]|nr:hypothetical protein BC833DRAFT_571630 [Globomyces pollinis-pini]
MGHVDLNRTAEECFLKDINTKKPILQIGSQTFSGQIHQNIGSIFFFDDEFQQSHRINRVVKFRKDKTDDTNETTAGGAATSST